MNRREIQATFDEVFDQAVLYHGFTDYMRDYEMAVYATADPRTGVQPQHLRLLFKHCVRATAATALTPEIWSSSLDEQLVEYPDAVVRVGHVWGVRWQLLYPGCRYSSTPLRPTGGRPRSGCRFMRPRQQ